MSSKINGYDGSRPAPVGAGKVSQGAQSPASGSSAGSGSTEGSGSIHITDAASQLAALAQATQELPAVDDVLVASVRGAIEQGTYTVSPQSIADNLVQMERSLGALG